MKRMLNKPHMFFWGLIPIILLIGMFEVYNSVDDFLDINIHDTYFVIDRFHLLGFMIFLFILLGLGYWGTYLNKRKLITGITFLHVILNFIALLSFVSSFFLSFEDVNMILTVGFLVFVLAQLLYPINILSALIREKND